MRSAVWPIRATVRTVVRCRQPLVEVRSLPLATWTPTIRLRRFSLWSSGPTNAYPSLKLTCGAAVGGKHPASWLDGRTSSVWRAMGSFESVYSGRQTTYGSPSVRPLHRHAFAPPATLDSPSMAVSSIPLDAMPYPFTCGS